MKKSKNIKVNYSDGLLFDYVVKETNIKSEDLFHMIFNLKAAKELIESYSTKKLNELIQVVDDTNEDIEKEQENDKKPSKNDEKTQKTLKNDIILPETNELENDGELIEEKQEKIAKSIKNIQKISENLQKTQKNHEIEKQNKSISLLDQIADKYGLKVVSAQKEDGRRVRYIKNVDGKKYSLPRLKKEYGITNIDSPELDHIFAK